MIAADENLVGYWAHVEGTGTTLYDYSSNSNNGTISNGSWEKNTKQADYSLIYNSTSTGVLSSYDSLNQSTVSFECLVKFDTTGNKNEILYQSTSNSSYFRFYFMKQNTDLLQFGFRPSATGTNTILNGTTSLSADTWYHCVFVIDTDNDDYRIYLNANLEDSDTTSLGTIENVASATGTYFGRTQSGNYHDGQMAHAKVYHKALTHNEVKAIYRQTYRV